MIHRDHPGGGLSRHEEAALCADKDARRWITDAMILAGISALLDAEEAKESGLREVADGEVVSAIFAAMWSEKISEDHP